MKIQKVVRNICSALLVTYVCTGCAPKELCSNQMWMDLSKNTEASYLVPYIIRYDKDSWSCRKYPARDDKTFVARNGNVEVTIKTFKNDPNLSHEVIAKAFQKFVALELTNSSNIEVFPSEIRELNGTTFVYNQARAIGESIPYKIFEYAWSGDEGTITLHFTINREMQDYEIARVDEFLRGFSLDGKACKGAAPLRFLKDVMETLEASDNPPALDVEPGIRIHKDQWGKR